MRVIGCNEIQDFEITDFEQYGLFALNGYESQLKTSLKDMKEAEETDPQKEYLRVLYGTYLYGDKEYPSYKEYMPLIMVQNNLNKWGLSTFENSGMENSYKAIIKADFNQGTNFPPEDNQLPLTIYLATIWENKMVQFEVELKELKSPDLHDKLSKTFHAYQLESDLNEKDNMVPKIKL